MTSRSTITSLFFLFYSLSEVALGADTLNNNQHIAGSESPITLSYIVQIFASFAVVILFILVLAWLMRKTGRFGSAGGNAFKVVSSLSLGMREKIILVNVAGVSIVVGVAPGQVRTLHVLDGKHEPEAETHSRDEKSFGRIIDKFMK